MAQTETRYVVDNAGISALFESANGACGQYVRSMGKRAEQMAKALVPVQTGRLRDSITSEVEGDTAIVSANTEYALFVELGTRNMAAQPFLRPAMLAAAGSAGEFL
jgi:HK97 gp10 family phage protein